MTKTGINLAHASANIGNNPLQQFLKAASARNESQLQCTRVHEQNTATGKRKQTQRDVAKCVQDSIKKIADNKVPTNRDNKKHKTRNSEKDTLSTLEQKKDNVKFNCKRNKEARLTFAQIKNKNTSKGAAINNKCTAVPCFAEKRTASCNNRENKGIHNKNNEIRDTTTSSRSNHRPCKLTKLNNDAKIAACHGAETNVKPLSPPRC